MQKPKKVKKASSDIRYIWGEDAGEKEFEVIRYDDEARARVVAALLAESRDMLKNS